MSEEAEKGEGGVFGGKGGAPKPKPYRVTRPCTIGGKVLAVGEEVRLAPVEAAPLVALGWIEAKG